MTGAPLIFGLAKKFVKQYFLLNSFMKLGPGRKGLGWGIIISNYHHLSSKSLPDVEQISSVGKGLSIEKFKIKTYQDKIEESLILTVVTIY